MTRVEKTYQQDVLRRRDIVVRGSLQADPFIQNDPQVHLTRWCWATSQKGSGSIPDGVIEIIHLLDPFGSGMALGSTQPLTEMSFFFPVALRPNAGHGLLILEVSRSHTTMQHIRYNSSGRVISSSQRPLPDNTQHSQQTKIHAPRWDLNPRPQTYALDRAATGTGLTEMSKRNISWGSRQPVTGLKNFATFMYRF